MEGASPCLILRGYMGNSLYSTQKFTDEYFTEFGQLILQTELTDLVSKDFGSLSLRQLQVQQLPSQLCPVRHLFCGRSLLTSNLGVKNDGIVVKSTTGHKVLSTGEYLDRIQIEQPFICLTLIDEVDPLQVGKNRLSKAMERNTNLLDEFMKKWRNQYSSTSKKTEIKEHGEVPLLFGVCPVARDDENTKVFIEKVLNIEEIAGLVVGSVNIGETEESFLSRIRFVKQTAAALLTDRTLPLMVSGCNTFRRLLLALREGVDYMSSDWPQMLTQKRHALQIDFDELRRRINNDHLEDVSPAKRARKNEDKGESISNSNSTGIDTSNKATDQSTPVVIDLLDKSKYEKDTNALSASCTHPACRLHSRAYIHHLLLAKEILGEVLIYHHNQFQLLKMVQELRKARENDVGSLVRGLDYLLEISSSLEE